MGHSFWTSQLVVVGALATLLAGCDRRIYVQDGVTDGDRFALPTIIPDGEHPATQAWVAYSLARSFCQLEDGGDNPARHSSFRCEFEARQALVARWREYTTYPADEASDYLELLSTVETEGHLAAYTWSYLARSGWQKPESLGLGEFEAWRDSALPARHRPVTRIIGSWSYAGPEGLGSP